MYTLYIHIHIYISCIIANIAFLADYLDAKMDICRSQHLKNMLKQSCVLDAADSFDFKCMLGKI